MAQLAVRVPEPISLYGMFLSAQCCFALGKAFVINEQFLNSECLNGVARTSSRFSRSIGWAFMLF
jgi:hypothetical protein